LTPILKYIFGALISIPVLPILYFQSMKLKGSMPDLPEASGTEGQVNSSSNKHLKIIALGESTVAGVGVETNEEGFMGEFARRMSLGLEANVTWKIYAKSGFTAQKVREQILPQIKDDTADLIIVGLGGNDSFKLKSPLSWQRNIEALIEEIRLQFPETPIGFTNIPPIKDFMAFTPLMQFVFGNMGEILGEQLAKITSEHPNVFYSPEKLTLQGLSKKYALDADLSEFFSDGVHPSKLTYHILARHFAEFLIAETKTKNLKL
jgi:lysophospholipase L1-like esterase